MSDKIFKIIDYINRNEPDQCRWGVCEDFATGPQFGAEWNILLGGKWLYHYRKADEKPIAPSSISLGLADDDTSWVDLWLLE